MEEETIQSKWNFDGAELYEIFELKRTFISSIRNWDLETAFWTLRDLRREIDAKLKRKTNVKSFINDEEENKQIKKKDKEENKKTEKKHVDDLIKGLDEDRMKFLSSNKTKEDKTAFYIRLEEVYMELCFIMKQHGLYFREGEDSTFAVFRR